MKCIFQLVDGDTGERSPALAHDRVAFAEVVKELLEKETVKPGDFVLVVVEHPDSSEACVSRAPLMSASLFVHSVLGVGPV